LISAFPFLFGGMESHIRPVRPYRQYQFESGWDALWLLSLLLRRTLCRFLCLTGLLLHLQPVFQRTFLLRIGIFKTVRQSPVKIKLLVK
jgi:hypothetical protein